MVDYGKSTDNLLDEILTYRKNRDNTKAWIEMYQAAHLIPEEVGSHLWELLMGIDTTLPQSVDA